MLIKEIIKENEVDIITDVIDQMPLECCVETFTSYIYKCSENKSSLGKLEAKFVNKMESNLHNLMADIWMQVVAERDKDEVIRELLIEGVYGYREEGLSEQLDWLDSNANSKDHFNLIRNFMYKCIDEVVKDENKDAKQKEQEALERRRKALKEDIERREEALNKAKKELEAIL